jgi:hypothetical protein
MTKAAFETFRFFRRRLVARDVRLEAAQGRLDVGALEQLAVLLLLEQDEDPEVRAAAAGTLRRLPSNALEALRAAPDAPPDVLALCARHGDTEEGGPAAAAGDDAQGLDAALADAEAPSWIDDDPVLQAEDAGNREGVVQRLAKMNFSERMKAAMKGSREVRAILVRDPSKMIACAVLKSPKLTEPEVEAFARMGNVSEDVLRTIGGNRAWMKNYGVVLALAKNAKTPLAMSLQLLNRLNDRDVANLSSDRNVPEPLRVAARKRVVSAVSRK